MRKDSISKSRGLVRGRGLRFNATRTDPAPGRAGSRRIRQKIAGEREFSVTREPSFQRRGVWYRGRTRSSAGRNARPRASRGAAPYKRAYHSGKVNLGSGVCQSYPDWAIEDKASLSSLGRGFFHNLQLGTYEREKEFKKRPARRHKGAGLVFSASLRTLCGIFACQFSLTFLWQRPVTVLLTKDGLRDQSIPAGFSPFGICKVARAHASLTVAALSECLQDNFATPAQRALADASVTYFVLVQQEKKECTWIGTKLCTGTVENRCVPTRNAEARAPRRPRYMPKVQDYGLCVPALACDVQEEEEEGLPMIMALAAAAIMRSEAAIFRGVASSVAPRQRPWAET